MNLLQGKFPRKHLQRSEFSLSDALVPIFLNPVVSDIILKVIVLVVDCNSGPGSIPSFHL